MRRRACRNRRVVSGRGRGLLNIIVPVLLAEFGRKDSILRKGIVKLYTTLKNRSIDYKKAPDNARKIDANYEILSEKDIDG
jgi:hypothetical protein